MNKKDEVEVEYNSINVINEYYKYVQLNLQLQQERYCNQNSMINTNIQTFIPAELGDIGDTAHLYIEIASGSDSWCFIDFQF